MTEAGLSLTEMIQVVVDIRTVCRMPVVLDAGGGWGDPVHIHRTIAMSEAAGVECIEIEDQLLPRRVEHHVGIDNLVPLALAADRIREAVAARTDPNLVIVGRTNAIRVGGMDDALRRAEAMKKAGADMLFVWGRKPEEMRTIAERLPAPLMTFAPPDGFSTFACSPRPRWPGWAIASPPPRALPSQRWSRRCGSSYECLGAGPPGPLPRPGRRREGDEGSAPGHRSRPAPGDRAADHEGGVRTLGSPRSLILKEPPTRSDDGASKDEWPGPQRSSRRVLRTLLRVRREMVAGLDPAAHIEDIAAAKGPKQHRKRR